MIHKLMKRDAVLILGAHPDDELGCGATIARLIESGSKVYHYFFSTCEESLKDINLPPEQLLNECNQSRKVLGLDLDNCGNYKFPVRYLPSFRQDILEELVKLKSMFKPDVIFVPNSNDIHQDHHCIYQEAVRAFKYSTILGYELPWNTLSMKHDCLLKIEDRHLQKKLKALACYKSQMHRNYANNQFFTALAQVRGVQANAQFAECFEVTRLFL